MSHETTVPDTSSDVRLSPGPWIRRVPDGAVSIASEEERLILRQPETTKTVRRIT